MSNKNFGQFTQESSPTTAQFVVGYDTAVSGGERRYAFSDVLGLFRTQVFSTANGILQADGAGNVTSTGLTYSGSTLSVPAGFVVSGAGSIALTAGGSNQNITLTPSGTGNFVNSFNSTAGPTPIAQALQIVGKDATQTILEIDTFGNQSRFIARRANGTAASPSAVTSGQTISQFGARGYGATAYGGATIGFNFIASENWTDSVQGTRGTLTFSVPNVTPATSTALEWGNGRVLWLGANNGTTSTWPAWGANGVLVATAATTFTDSSSSGTVATAVANSFAVPTFAASSATTFTNAANLYIAGDVANGTNVTLTNSYGLWNAGKTRLDGITSITNNTVATSPTNGALVITGGIGAENIYANGSGRFGSRVQIGTGATSQFSLIVTGQLTSGNATQFIVSSDGTVGTDATTIADGINSRVRTQATAVTYASVAALHAADAIKGSGSTHTNAYGLLVDNITTGATNYAIKTGTGIVQFNTATLDGSANTTFTGGTGNMTITAGTGASRTLTLQTTTSGGTATNALVLSATQNATFGGSVTTSAPNGGTAGAWKMGILVSAAVALDTTRYIQLDVGGTLYKVLVST